MAGFPDRAVRPGPRSPPFSEPDFYPFPLAPLRLASIFMESGGRRTPPNVAP